MVANNRRKKRVRIQSGHEARYIENRNSSHCRKKSRPRISRKGVQKASRRDGGSSGGPGRMGQVRTHRASVSELVYQYLERASNRGVVRSQKTNASNKFRKLQRRKFSKRLRPDRSPGPVPPPLGRNSFNDEENRNLTRRRDEELTKPCKQEGPNSIQKCIYEVLSFGTVLGLLVPADKHGCVFRVSSELELFDRLQQTDSRRRLDRKRRGSNFNNEEAPPSKRRC